MGVVQTGNPGRASGNARRSIGGIEFHGGEARDDRVERVGGEGFPLFKSHVPEPLQMHYCTGRRNRDGRTVGEMAHYRTVLLTICLTLTAGGCSSRESGQDGKVSAPTATVKTPLPTRPGVYDPSTSTFFIQPASGDPIGFAFAAAGNIPVAGDWDGDGLSTVGVYSPEIGNFFLTNTNGPGGASDAFAFGKPGLLPLAGDWDGDGRDSVAVYEAATGTFVLTNENASGEAVESFVFGTPNLVPISGDWDGDGRDTVGVYNPESASFSLTNGNAATGAMEAINFGGPNLVPITGDWDADGKDTVGIYIASSGAFMMRNSLTAGPADTVVTLGKPGLVPLVGAWNR